MSNNRLSKKAGLPPGSLIHIGRKSGIAAKISVLDFDKDQIQEIECKEPAECFPFKETKTTSWINIDGLQETDIISSIGTHFGIHSLALEDILNTNHRPKIEMDDKSIFLSFKMLGIGEDGKSIVSEQISLVLGDNWLISFQEEEGDVFDSLRERIRKDKGEVRTRGADYLFYRLIDTIVDNYFIVIEYLNDSAEDLEESVLKAPDQDALLEIQNLKREISKLRKSIHPVREIIAVLYREKSDLIHEDTIRYFRDVYEHIIQINDSLETQKDLLAGIMELYLSGVSHRMNKVMQLLTLISTIFIPLTFIAGIYGMNFNNMPELGWRYGYLTIWIIMIVIALIMLIYFRRKKWL